MAIVTCSECGAQVSTGARTCPNCGYSPNTTCAYCTSCDGYDCECYYCSKTPDDPACPHFVYEDYD